MTSPASIRYLRTLLLALALSCSAAAPVMAAQGYGSGPSGTGPNGTGPNGANSFLSNQAGISPREAAAIARRQHHQGRVLSVKPNQSIKGYRVRMLVDGGRVVTVNVDGKGRVRDK